MANSHQDLKDKIDEEPLNAGRTDQQVLDWLNESETRILALDVEFIDFEEWTASQKLYSEIHGDAETTPFNDNSSCARMMDLVLERGTDLQSSKQSVIDTLDDGTGGGNVMNAAQRAALDALIFPQVPRWENADWNRQPLLGDVIAARALP